MNWYKDIPIWENKKRIAMLIKCRNLIVEYFNNIKHTEPYNEPIESDKSNKARLEINLIFGKIHSIVINAGTTPEIYYSAPLGRMTGNVDLLANIFNPNLKLDPKYLLDLIDRTIGVYSDDTINAFIRTINPLYWILRLLNFIGKIPFILLGIAGFNQTKIETSFWGKLFKALLYLITIIASLLTIMEKLGYLEQFKKIIFRK